MNFASEWRRSQYNLCSLLLLLLWWWSVEKKSNGQVNKWIYCCAAIDSYKNCPLTQIKAQKPNFRETKAAALNSHRNQIIPCSPPSVIECWNNFLAKPETFSMWWTCVPIYVPNINNRPSCRALRCLSAAASCNNTNANNKPHFSFILCNTHVVIAATGYENRTGSVGGSFVGSQWIGTTPPNKITKTTTEGEEISRTRVIIYLLTADPPYHLPCPSTSPFVLSPHMTDWTELRHSQSPFTLVLRTLIIGCVGGNAEPAGEWQ